MRVQSLLSPKSKRGSGGPVAMVLCLRHHESTAMFFVFVLLGSTVDSEHCSSLVELDYSILSLDFSLGFVQ